MAPRSSTPITRRHSVASSASPDSFQSKAVSKTQLQRLRSESPTPVPRLQLQRLHSRSPSPAAKTQIQGQRSDDSLGAFIRVVARVRPKLPHEAHATCGVEVDVGSRSLTLTSSSSKGKKFYVDDVFDSRQEQGSQDGIFSGFAMNYVHHSLSGYNVCLFAYGHTGSGKTYTMLGDQNHDGIGIGSQAGIMPRFLHGLFSAHACDAEQHVRRYTCEFYEVYNEQIKDLLVPVKSCERTRKVHVHPKHGVRVENLTMSVVSSAEEALQLVDFGKKMRAVAATARNARSSRSHAVFTFKYEQDMCDAQRRRSMVTFVDLAGREDLGASQNGATHMREMCCINTSLFHLANVITKLSQGSINGRSLADFRNSKLTLLLSPALMGNSKTALIATISPLQELFDDSLCTMNFAASVKKIKTHPVINNKAPNSIVSELEAEVRQLQSELNIAKTKEAEKERALLSARAHVSIYKTSWEEALQKSKQSETKREKSLKSLQLQSDGSSDSLSSSSSSADSSSTGLSFSPGGSPITFDVPQSPDVTMNASSEDITCWFSPCLQVQDISSGKSSVCSSQQGSGSITPADGTDYPDAAKVGLKQCRSTLRPSPFSGKSTACSSQQGSGSVTPTDGTNCDDAAESCLKQYRPKLRPSPFGFKSWVYSSQQGSGSITPTDGTDYHDAAKSCLRQVHPKPRPSPSSAATSTRSASPAKPADISQEVSDELRRKMTPVFDLVIEEFIKHCSLDAEQCSTHTAVRVSTSSGGQIWYRPKPYAASASRSPEDPMMHCPEPSAPLAGRTSEEPIACRPEPGTPTLRADASLEHLGQRMQMGAIGNTPEYRSSRCSLSPARSCFSAEAAPLNCLTPIPRRHSIVGPLVSTYRALSPAP